ncbi:plasmid pRiA4b ORF-3 family protein [Algivirga pacifica]|uniref:Plasmid pRiA4b ORF-3 family protein n=1 Tax=Algivirga pacifica TaxID=1162670 RepID=A0ABP9DL53_9BACT
MDNQVYQFKLTLVDSKPTIWRRFVVNSAINFEELHYTIQVLMGWSDAHLWSFTNPESGKEIGPEQDNYQETILSQVIQNPKDTLLYEYDFGDAWLHELKLEKVLPVEEGQFYPACTAGAGAGPLEDCGGIWAYRDMMDAFKNPKHKEHEEIMEWFKEIELEDFDPDYFDQETVNEWLKELYED